MGCGYTGKAGGPMRMETPTAICACAGDGSAGENHEQHKTSF
jgi:hypothetical protein